MWRDARLRSSGTCPKPELKPSFHFSSPSSRASMRTGLAELISVVEAVAVCLDIVSLLCVVTRRSTAAAFFFPEPMLIGSNGLEAQLRGTGCRQLLRPRRPGIHAHLSQFDIIRSIGRREFGA